MKDTRLFFRTVLLPLWAVLILPALPACAYEILTPPAGQSLVQTRRPQAHMVIKAAGQDEAGKLRVGRVLDREGKTGAIAPAGSWEKDGAVYVHYLLELQRGVNNYTVNPGERDFAVRYQPMHTLLKLKQDDPQVFLFHRDEVVPSPCAGCHTDKLPADAGLDVELLQKNSDFSPVCFSCHRRMISRDQWLHAPAATMACMTCHRRDNKAGGVTILTGRVDDSCFSCHINKRKWTKKGFVHGPAATGDCTVCHDPHGAAHPFMLWADPKIDICIVCHTDQQDIKKKQQGFFQHGIIEGSGCSACHSPHASDFRFQLAGPINEVCVSCHIGMKGMEKGHPVGNHPLSGPEDTRRKGREFSCSSCHNPHGERYKFLLIGNLLGGHVCGKCHN